MNVVICLQEASLDHAFIIRFCEFLLHRSMPRQDAFASPAEWTTQKQILLKYVQVSCSHVVHRQAAVEEQLSRVRCRPLSCLEHPGIHLAKP